MSLIEEALRRTQQTAGQDAKRQDHQATEPGTPPPGGVDEGRVPPHSAFRSLSDSGRSRSAETRSVKPAKAATPLPSQGGSRLRARIEKGVLIGGSALIAGIVMWEAWVYVAPATGRLRRPVAVAPPPAVAQVVETSFSPAMPQPLPQPTLRLSGIVGGLGEPLAIINGTIVRVGEMVAGATLLEVGEDFARLRWRDQDVLLRTGEWHATEPGYPAHGGVGDGSAERRSPRPTEAGTTAEAGVGEGRVPAHSAFHSLSDSDRSRSADAREREAD